MSHSSDDLTERNLNEKRLQLLLQPIKNLSVISDSESDCSSGIIDVFAELHKDSFLRPLPGTKTKYLTKLEADRKTVDRFTNDFKRAIKETREELKIDNNMTSGVEDSVENILKSSEKEVFFKGPDKIPIEDPISVPSEVTVSDTTSNSAVWNMIKAHRGLYFYASPPHYDIYSIQPDHYLKRPHMPWIKLNESKKKCENWLKQQC